LKNVPQTPPFLRISLKDVSDDIEKSQGQYGTLGVEVCHPSGEISESLGTKRNEFLTSLIQRLCHLSTTGTI
jgi:hypothetical protein